MKRLQIDAPNDLVEDIDAMATEKGFRIRAEFLRSILVEARDKWQENKRRVREKANGARKRKPGKASQRARSA